MAKAKRIRQAVVIIHGMGEHRPLDTLNQFIGSGLQPVEGKRRFYSRPDQVTKSYESRRYLAPRQPPNPAQRGVYEQTEFYEYHWAHLMQGNKLSDLWPSFSRMLLRWPWAVPEGLRVVWALFWALLILSAIFFVIGPGRQLNLTGNPVEDLLRPIIGIGLFGVVLTYLLVTVLGSWVTSSFVDVVRYLDTSPRSYQVRRDIREGIVALLRGLHESDSKYQRIIVVAHSLGSYIAYDAISYLWGQLNDKHAGKLDGASPPAGLAELEAAAFALNRATPDALSAARTRYRAAQRALWLGVRAYGNPWLISDLITLGSPMYFADRLYTKNRSDFDERVARRELPTCPPQPDERPKQDPDKPPVYSYRDPATRRRVLYHGAPFSVVRWTNMWFPARARFFGDWFGGPLSPLYGNGIEDISLPGDGWTSHVPAWAHARYFSFPEHSATTSVTTYLRSAMELDSGSWLPITPGELPPDATLA
ncbi:MAG: hypothetical protein ABI534_10115 [Chloroflexota bacterium]